MKVVPARSPGYRRYVIPGTLVQFVGSPAGEFWVVPNHPFSDAAGEFTHRKYKSLYGARMAWNAGRPRSNGRSL